ncbi:MAG: rod shape-determining protein RodA [Bacteroidales bacterium]|nr:rod shape-determining protein RodA [Bacteroidales bacterium]
MGYNNYIYRKLDWWLIITYLLLVFIGWMNIYAAVYTEEHSSIFDFSQRYGMQFVWIVTSFLIAAAILFILNPKIYSVLSPPIYLFVLLLLFAVIFVGKEVNGSKSWFVIGPVGFQPAEISKISTSLFLAYIMSQYGFKLSRLRNAITVALVLLIPMLFIILEKETGSALVYTGFIFMLYREGLNGWILAFGFLSIFLFVISLAIAPFVAIICLMVIMALLNGLTSREVYKHMAFVIPLTLFLAYLPKILQMEFMDFIPEIKIEYWVLGIILPFMVYAVIRAAKKRMPHTKYIAACFCFSVMFIFSVNFIFNNILQPHQRARIENLLGITEDLKGAGYNVHQSKIAIGSGGFAGKGFLEGTQTKFDFVPEQSTDFIFCTVGEEHGFIGAASVIALYMFLIIRLIILSERQKDKFVKIYGYCVACCFFMHVFINIGMTMGLVPVIGIPLPFLSYGGSSLWSFTILLFIFIRLDLERWN